MKARLIAMLGAIGTLLVLTVSMHGDAPFAWRECSFLCDKANNSFGMPSCQPSLLTCTGSCGINVTTDDCYSTKFQWRYATTLNASCEDGSTSTQGYTASCIAELDQNLQTQCYCPDKSDLSNWSAAGNPFNGVCKTCTGPECL